LSNVSQVNHCQRSRENGSDKRNIIIINKKFKTSIAQDDLTSEIEREGIKARKMILHEK